MASKVVLPVVSLILVVGVVIGAVVVVRHGHAGDGKTDGVAPASGSMKSVTTFCAPAAFKDACAKSVESVANNATATPKDYILAAIQATVAEVKKGLDVASNTNVDEKEDPYHHMAVEDCKELLGYAVDELQAAISSVGDSEMHTLSDRVDELLNWLSAVYSYQSSCLESFEKPELKSAIENGLVNATQLTNNAVDIVAGLTDLLKAFNIPLVNDSSSRRLLQDSDDGYPTWFQAADRKLLADHGAGRVVPNAVVAHDGSGRFKTISDAVAAYPPNFQGRYIIYVKTGVYDETVTIDRKKPNVFIYGDGAGKTIVTGKKNYQIMHFTTSNTSPFC